MRFYYPTSGAGKTIAEETLVGAFAEALTRIDELSDRLKAIECSVGGQHWLKK
jgi:hypothetical protein